jgi:hypothetical protein
MKQTKVKASKLVLDYTLYPREQIQSYHVGQIAEALEAGTVLPPIVVDRKSQRITDGFHRVKAYRKVFGKDAQIPAVFKDYESEAEMFADAIVLNAAHGKNLTPYDRARCIARAEELNMAPDEVARALNMTVESLGELKAERLAYFHAKPIVLKRTTAHLAGEELTDDQMEYNRRSGGMNQDFYINQLIGMLEADAVDWESEKVVGALKRLKELLDKSLMPVGV